MFMFASHVHVHAAHRQGFIPTSVAGSGRGSEDHPELQRLGNLIAANVVRAGEVLCIPPHLPHEAWALEDTVDLDVFDPPREDWLNKTDDYLRHGR